MSATAKYLFPEGKIKALTMSYDDGPSGDRRLVEIFNRHGIIGTFHLNSAFLSHDPNGSHIAVEEAAALYKGHEISCHSASHPFLERLPVMEAMGQIWRDRAALEAIAGYPVVSASYPYGSYSPAVVEVLKNAGIQCCRAVAPSHNFSLPQDFLTWSPTCHHNESLELIPKFLACKHPLSVFFVWGHSFEFDRQNNWDMIENFCQQMENLPDVWYATNIQICRYVQAVRSMVVSTDGHTLYNPSAQTIWCQSDNDVFSVKPGETVKY